jgi:HD superfamily phosphodiesterase
MLTRKESRGVLAAYGQDAAWTAHCVAVADASARVGGVLAAHRPVDVSFLWSAALLHDIGRYTTHDPLRHGAAGYHLLSELGHAKEAHVCASHILFGLDAAEAAHIGLPAQDFVPSTTEEKLVALVDYLIEYDRPTTLERRFASLRARNRGNTFFVTRLDRAQESARRFMTRIEDNIGESVEEIVASNAVR